MTWGVQKPAQGIEHWTFRLQDCCSATELCRLLSSCAINERIRPEHELMDSIDASSCLVRE
eukprot:4438868-Amphidinium_carterae.1